MTVPACRAHCCRPIRCRGPRSPPSLSSFIFYVCKQEPHLWHTIFLCTCISKVCLNICISPPGLPDKSCFYNCSQTKDPKCFYPNSFFFFFFFGLFVGGVQIAHVNTWCPVDSFVLYSNLDSGFCIMCGPGRDDAVILLTGVLGQIHLPCVWQLFRLPKCKC